VKKSAFEKLTFETSSHFDKLIVGKNLLKKKMLLENFTVHFSKLGFVYGSL
jgi:hypothetical protein